MTYFGILINKHLNIIVLKKLFFNYFLKNYLKNSKKILRIKQWSKGACVAPTSVVGPINFNKIFYGEKNSLSHHITQKKKKPKKKTPFVFSKHPIPHHQKNNSLEF
jgi:hypothetical protein